MNDSAQLHKTQPCFFILDIKPFQPLGEREMSSIQVLCTNLRGFVLDGKQNEKVIYILNVTTEVNVVIDSHAARRISITLGKNIKSRCLNMTQ